MADKVMWRLFCIVCWAGTSVLAVAGDISVAEPRQELSLDEIHFLRKKVRSVNVGW